MWISTFSSSSGSSTLYSCRLPAQILGKLLRVKQPLLKLSMVPGDSENISESHQSRASWWTAWQPFALPQQCQNTEATSLRAFLRSQSTWRRTDWTLSLTASLWNTQVPASLTFQRTLENIFIAFYHCSVN